MVKRLFQIIFCVSVLSMPMCGMVSVAAPATDSGIAQVERAKVTVKGRQVRVQQAQGATLEIYSVTGTKVLALKLDSNDETFQLKLGRGCYIIKVRDVARKISLL